MIRSTLAVLFVCAAPALSFAQGGDSEKGRRVASESCSACHQMDGGGLSNGSGPSFYAISRMPSTTELSLKVFLRSSHRNMPNFMLGADEIDSVVSYVLGLAPR